MSYCEQMFKYGLGGEDWHKFKKRGFLRAFNWVLFRSAKDDIKV